jgi:hypothetical protein
MKSQFRLNKYVCNFVTGKCDALPKCVFAYFLFKCALFFHQYFLPIVNTPRPLRSVSSALFYILLRDLLLFVFLSLSGVFLYLYALNERESFDISLSSPFRGFRPIWSFRHRASSCGITTHTRYLPSDLIYCLFYPLWNRQEVISLCFPFRFYANWPMSRIVGTSWR